MCVCKRADAMTKNVIMTLVSPCERSFCKKLSDAWQYCLLLLNHGKRDDADTYQISSRIHKHETGYTQDVFSETVWNRFKKACHKISQK